MKRRLLVITTLFACGLLLALLLLTTFFKSPKKEEYNGEYILALNEIQQLSKQGMEKEESYALVQEKIEQLQEQIRHQTTKEQESKYRQIIMIVAIICLVFLYGVFSYVYYAILRPFEKMKAYAQEIANGNFDLPLDYERSNYFGEFTWAFDQMRCEIIKSRSCEKEAIENNKTVIATLSHDIKTPIASIRAYAEGLEASLDSSMEKRARYTSVIMRKCDEVASLTNDLFLHSLSNLDKLQVTLEETELIQLLSDLIHDLEAEKKDIRYIVSDDVAYVMVDQKRLVQVMENLVNNARKYAKSNILITTDKKEDSVYIYVRDYGAGIPNEDMPFIFDKFYRGHNKGEEQGSGLGLYITRYLLTQMQGQIQLHNLSDGLEVVLILPLH